MASSDLAYCDQCGGASPRRATVCRFCGAALPPPRAPVHPPAGGPGAPLPGGSGAPPPGLHPGAADAAAGGGHPGSDDDPWADLTAPDPAPPAAEADLWGDPAGLPWRDEPDPSGDLPPTEVGTWQGASTVPPVFAAPAVDDLGGEPTRVHEPWTDGPLIEPGAEGPRRGLPGWAWVASVVLLGTLLGVGAYIVVDQADDGSVRTEGSTTSSSTSTSTSSTTSTSTTTSTAPATTVPVVPATPPATPPDSGPPTVPGAVTTPTTLAPTTVATTPAPTTTPPTTPPPTTAPPTTPPPTTPPPTTPAPTAPPPGGTVPGDLGIPGAPMTQPACDGQYVTFLASAKNTTGPAMQQALESYPGSHYLRTDQTCPSLNAPASDGTPLYRIYAGPYADVAEACAARSQSTQGAFVKRLSTTDPPAHVVTCP